MTKVSTGGSGPSLRYMIRTLIRNGRQEARDSAQTRSITRLRHSQQQMLLVAANALKRSSRPFITTPPSRTLATSPWSSESHLVTSTNPGRRSSTRIQSNNTWPATSHRCFPRRIQFHTSPASRSNHPPTVFADPDRPDLFYHLLEPPTLISRTHPVYGVSFLDSLGSSPGIPIADSPKIVGYLPAAIPGEERDTAGRTEAGLNDFKENSEFSLPFLPEHPHTRNSSCLTISHTLARFREILHTAIKEGLAEGVDDIQINGALQLHQGWMHIHGAYLH
jgi:hypothetical protein